MTWLSRMKRAAASGNGACFSVAEVRQIIATVETMQQNMNVMHAQLGAVMKRVAAAAETKQKDTANETHGPGTT
jgi:signal recognition particle GTPase